MDAPCLYRADELDAWGCHDRARARAVRSGMLVGLRAGVFVTGDDWSRSSPEERIAARAAALASVSDRPPVFSHDTAAALHGLPLYRPRTERVHVIVPVERPGRAAGTIRHRGDLPAEEIVSIRGILCTSLERTVADAARTCAIEPAVTIADAALRAAAVVQGEYDPSRAAALVERTRRIVRRSAHGQRRADRVLAFADGRAERPGESVSRIRLGELGFARPGLQLAVPRPAGRPYRVDFDLTDAAALGEFDGRIKYVDGRFTVERTADEVFEREKEREDWIRGVTGRPLVRWGWAHISSAAALGARLAAFGVHPPR